MSEIYYRFEERHYAPPVDEFDNPIGEGRCAVVLLKYPVKKHTPKGVRLKTGRFVLNTARKRFACATVEEAVTSFIARKRKQIQILMHQARRAQVALDACRNRDIEYALVIDDTQFIPEWNYSSERGDSNSQLLIDPLRLQKEV